MTLFCSFSTDRRAQWIVILVLGHVASRFSKAWLSSSLLHVYAHRRLGMVRVFVVESLQSWTEWWSSISILPVLFSLDLLHPQPLPVEVSQPARRSGCVRYNIDLFNLAMLWSGRPNTNRPSARCCCSQRRDAVCLILPGRGCRFSHEAEGLRLGEVAVISRRWAAHLGFPCAVLSWFHPDLLVNYRLYTPLFLLLFTLDLILWLVTIGIYC